jgi:signal transduction histidine kinase
VRSETEQSVALADLKRSERTMLIARAVGAPWAFFQIFTYSAQLWPPGAKEWAISLASLLLLGNVAVFVAHRRIRTLRGAKKLAGASLSLDLVVISGIVWLFAFDPNSALWAVLFILPLEGAMRFQLQGALAAWAGSTLLYVGREMSAAERFGYTVEWNSVTFRMGIGLIIALVAGLMARDLVRQRTRLASALHDLQTVDSMRAALVSTLAHDVRNPLTAIRGALKTLLSRPELVNSDAAISLLEAADRQSDRLTRLAGDLLDLARLEQGRLDLHIRTVPLREAVDTAIRFLEPTEVLQVDVDPTITVEADPDRLQQVLINLASNATRYGEPPFLVEAARRPGEVDLSFRDHGAGVMDSQREGLFEAFGQHAEDGSVGFGLTIVKALVEAQDGRVRYEPNQPRGARFTISLPEGRKTADTYRDEPDARQIDGQASSSPGKR